MLGGVWRYGPILDGNFEEERKKEKETRTLVRIVRIGIPVLLVRAKRIFHQVLIDCLIGIVWLDAGRVGR